MWWRHDASKCKTKPVYHPLKCSPCSKPNQDWEPLFPIAQRYIPRRALWFTPELSSDMGFRSAFVPCQQQWRSPASLTQRVHLTERHEGLSSGARSSAAAGTSHPPSARPLACAPSLMPSQMLKSLMISPGPVSDRAGDSGCLRDILSSSARAVVAECLLCAPFNAVLSSAGNNWRQCPLRGLPCDSLFSVLKQTKPLGPKHPGV